MAMYYRGKEYETTEPRVPQDSRILTVLWGFAKPFKGWLLLTLAIMLLGTAADLLRPYLLKVAIDDHISARNLAGLYTVASIYMATIGISFVLAYGQTMLLQYIGQHIIFDIRQRVFHETLLQPYVSLVNQPVGRTVTRVTNDTDAIRDLYTDVLVAFVSDILILAGIIVVMLVINWQLALVCFGVLPLMFVLALLYQKFARKAYRLVRETTAGLNTYIQESLTGIGVIKSFARFRRTDGEYKVASDEYLAAGLREMRTFAIFRPLVDLVYSLAIVIVLYASNWHAIGATEVGVVVAFLRYVEKFFWPIKDLAEKYSLLQSALAAAERVWDLIATDTSSPESGIAQFPVIHGSIRFDKVWFAYEEPNWVLKDVSFFIPAGQFIGFVGLSGSGKTTILNLLLRFYEPQRGAIYLDGTDIRMLDTTTLRKTIGVVFQDIHLFKGSVADNIRLYDPSISASEVEQAAQIAAIHRSIMKMPQGYDTPVGYQGSMLSRGECQLLSLARALAVKRTILVLDEATSSIDSETETAIQTSLERAASSHTVIIVAHRLSTIQKAQKIIVMHRGQIAEEGAHEELIANKGLYYRIYNSQ